MNKLLEFFIYSRDQKPYLLEYNIFFPSLEWPSSDLVNADNTPSIFTTFSFCNNVAIAQISYPYNFFVVDFNRYEMMSR